MQMLQAGNLKRYARVAWDALFFITEGESEPGDRWKFRRRLVYGAYRVSVAMIIFGAVTFLWDTQVSNNLITGGVALLTIIVSAYVAGAVADDKLNQKKEP